jgi:hypothetical protein
MSTDDECYRLARLRDGVEAGTALLRETLPDDHWVRPWLERIDATVNAVRQDMAQALLFGLEPGIAANERRLFEAVSWIHGAATREGFLCPLCREPVSA